MGILNSILFPKPQATYDITSITNQHSVKMFSAHNKTCSLFMPYSQDQKHISSKALIYFHGNAEDLGESVYWLAEMQSMLKLNIFANQYPQYGVHRKTPCSPQTIKQQAVALYKFVNETLKFDHKDIVVVGRSIGSGPACHVAGNTKCQNLVLISPFFNIKSMIDEKTKFLGWFFDEVFPNDENLRATQARLINIHGVQDEVISVRNSQRIQHLYVVERKRTDGVFLFHKHMSHNQFHLREDIIQPVQKFLKFDNQFERDYESIKEVLKPYLFKT